MIFNTGLLLCINWIISSSSSSSCLHLQVFFIFKSSSSSSLLHLQVTFVFKSSSKSSSSSSLLHHEIQIIMTARSSSLYHHQIWIIIKSGSSSHLDHQVWIIIIGAISEWCYISILLVTGSSIEPSIFYPSCRPTLHAGLRHLSLTLSQNGPRSSYIWPHLVRKAFPALTFNLILLERPSTHI